MGAIRNGLAALLAGLLLACSGGGDGYGESVVPARAGSAQIAAAGGSVDAVLEGGTTVRLDVPADALATATTLRIDPLAAPAGSLGSFRISPAGIVLLKPVTLTLHLPSGTTVDADTNLLLDTGARQVPLEASVDIAARTVVVSLHSLGSPVASAAPALGRVRALASSIGTGSLTLLLARSRFAQRLNLLDLVVGDLAAAGSVDNAEHVQLAMASVLGQPAANTEPRVRADVVVWRRVVCGQQQFSVSALNTFAGVDIQTFEQRAKDVLAWDRLAVELNRLVLLLSPSEAGCPGLPADVADPVRAQLPTFLANVRQALDLLDPNVAADYTQLFGLRFADLLNLAADFGGIGAQDLEVATLGVVFSEIERARAVGYAACRAHRDQALQARLLKEAVLNEARSPVKPPDVLQDVQFCGMGLHWKLLDAQGAVLQQGDAGGTGPGLTEVAATLRVAGAAGLAVTGPLGALVCPLGSQNNEQLVFAAGPAAGPLTSEKQLTPSNANGYLEAGGIVIDIPSLTSRGADRIRVARQGGLCNGEFLNLGAHGTIASFSLDPSTLQITTPGLPNATEGTPYSVTLAATGGTLPFVWSAAGLPAGLSLDVQTGVLSGTPAAAGTSSLVIGVRSAEGFTARATLALAVLPRSVSVPDVAGRYTGTHVDNTFGGNPPPATFIVRQSGNLVLIGNGSGGSLCELAPGGGLTFLGFSSGDFVVNPDIRVTTSFTGQFLGTSLTFRVVDLVAGSDGKRDDDSFFLTRQ